MSGKAEMTDAEKEAAKLEEKLGSMGEVRSPFYGPADRKVTPEKVGDTTDSAKAKDPDKGDKDTPPGEGGKVDGKVVVTGEEDGIPDLGEGETPKPKDWANLRNIAKEQKKRIREMEQRMKDLEKGTVRQDPPTTVTTGEPARKEAAGGDAEVISDEDTFVSIVSARAGDFDKDETGRPGINSKNIEKLALECIQSMTPDRILKVLDKARQGGFGEQSGDVLVVAREALSEVTARRGVEEDETIRANQAREEFEASVARAYEKAQNDIPDLKDHNSEFYKFAGEWGARNLLKADKDGKIVSTGPLIKLLENPEWPLVVYPMILDAYKAQNLDKTRVELDATRKRVDTLLSPESSGHRNSADGSGQASSLAAKEAADLEKKLEGMGNIKQ